MTGYLTGYEIPTAMLVLGVMWFLLKVQDSFRTKDDDATPSMLFWMRHGINMFSFVWLMVVGDVALKIAADNSAPAGLQSLLETCYIAFVSLMSLVLAFYIIIAIRAFLIWLIELRKEKTGTAVMK
jgi:hypothetical protein